MISNRVPGFSLKRMRSNQVAKRRLLLLKASLSLAYSPRSSKMPRLYLFLLMPRLFVAL
jgi:hypothetical protein